MTSFFGGLDGFAIFFLLCALVGGFFVLLRFIVQFVGGDVGDAGIDPQLDVELEVQHADSDLGFKLLSLQGLSAFLLMFGLVGLALYQQSRAGFLLSIVGAVVAGLIAVWVIGRLFALAHRMQSSGTRDNIAAAVGCSGTVYSRIPAGGSGQVTIAIQGRQREFVAMTVDGSEVPSGTLVRVVRVNAGILVVEKLT
jgi:membrane protein implicated in regulation of membrane protease activity